jgi:hypothetical protein
MAQAVLPGQAAGKEAKQDQPKDADEDHLTNQLSAMLQACSYDGKAMKVDAKAMKTSTEAEGAAAVGRIMRYTGLPQNFQIMEGDVPNAAAIIVMGQDGIPKRVIAYNRDFMGAVARATGDSDWAGASILAHEIGHHLSGHTLMPGGSQPPLELEADKFSGFVLFKMGASLPQAEKAIATLIPDADGATHPGRKKRLAAVEAGWQQSCEQQREKCGDGMVVAAAGPRDPAVPKQVEPQSVVRSLPQWGPRREIQRCLQMAAAQCRCRIFPDRQTSMFRAPVVAHQSIQRRWSTMSPSSLPTPLHRNSVDSL